MELAAPAGGGPGSYLTGDGGVVLLSATLTWHVVDPVAYHQARLHVTPALNRLFAASAVSLAAGRPIDEFLVVRTEGDGADPMVQAQRQALRGVLVADLNRRLQDLEAQQAPLGIEVTRADLQAQLPPDAKPGFDAVLTATQRAEEELAAARTQALQTRQTAQREQDSVLTAADAEAAERVNTARTQVAAIVALETADDPSGRPGLLDRLYRERIATVLGQAGQVMTVDPRGGTRFILPGSQP